MRCQIIFDWLKKKKTEAGKCNSKKTHFDSLAWQDDRSDDLLQVQEGQPYHALLSFQEDPQVPSVLEFRQILVAHLGPKKVKEEYEFWNTVLTLSPPMTEFFGNPCFHCYTV